MSPGQRRQRARKRRAKGRTRADRRALSKYIPVKPPAPGSLIPMAVGVGSTPGKQPTRRVALALGGGHVHLGEIPTFAIPGYDLLAAHPFLVAALVGGDVTPGSLIVEVLAHAVLEPAPGPTVAGGSHILDVINARFHGGQLIERCRTHAWVVLFDDSAPAASAPIGVVITDESLQHGFGPKAGRDVLPFTPIMLEPDHAVQATAKPQVANFRPDRLHIGGGQDVAADFIVENISIRNRSQFAQAGGIPADMFAATAIDAFVSFDSAGIGDDITITVRNVGQQPRQLVMAMIGTVMNRIRVAVTTHANIKAAVASILSEPLRADLRAQLG